MDTEERWRIKKNVSSHFNGTHLKKKEEKKRKRLFLV